MNWIPEMWFEDDAKETVGGCIPKDRFQIKKGGAVINCDYRNCKRNFFVRDAIRQGNIEKWDTMLDELDNPDDEDGIPIFCQEHQ